jgi:hypothetical protein
LNHSIKCYKIFFSKYTVKIINLPMIVRKNCLICMLVSRTEMKKLARWFQDFLKMSVAPAHNYSNSSQIAWTKTERRRLDVGPSSFLSNLVYTDNTSSKSNVFSKFFIFNILMISKNALFKLYSKYTYLLCILFYIQD